ncbi:MAG: endonuclease [Candidatus Krumholzibacteriia bacterium]
MHPIARRTFALFLPACLLALALSGCSPEPSPLVPDPGPATVDLAVKSAPAGYYDTVDDSNAAALRSTLHAVIDDHTRFPYTDTSTDTWDVLEPAQQDPANSARIIDIYLNASYPKYTTGNTDYDREHSWPKSYGFPNDTSSNYPYTDCHQLFLANGAYNGSRSNKPFRYCSSGCDEKPTLFTNGIGGGTGVYPGNSNWTSGSFTQGSWEVWMSRRGDIARAMFYMDVRYEGGVHGITGYGEPDLRLTDSEALIDASNTGSNESVAYMGMLSVLLEWHEQDPVDAWEMNRNDVVYSYQGNRNPFVDHPEWVSCLFNGICGGGDVTPPAAPTGLTASPGDGSVTLDWNDNTEGDLTGYAVYRATAPSGPYNQVGGLVISSSYQDSGLVNGTTYYYVVTALDTGDNESPSSSEASATPQGGGIGGDPTAWINEFHYDNAGTDAGEFFEIAGTAGLNLSGWSVVGYNGNGGGQYDTVALSGTLPDLMNGFGALSFGMTGMQNGSPDALALVDDTGAVVLFIGYEGPMTATDGPASGLTAADVGVAEDGTTPIGHSLQLAGTGSQYGDFTWQAPQTDTPAAVNTGQVFVGVAINQDPVAAAGGPYGGEKGVAVSFTSAGSYDPDGSIVSYLWTFGDGGTSTAAHPDHTYTTPGAFTVTLTVTDDQGAQHTDTTSANITDTTPPVVMHVGGIALKTAPDGRKIFGAAEVLVLDDQGNPVAGVTVTGTFGGGVSGADSAVTDADGIALLASATSAPAPMTFSFCVDDAAKADATYDAGANLKDCGEVRVPASGFDRPFLEKQPLP